MPTFYHLSIAVNKYQHDKINNLYGCIHDAEAFAEAVNLYIDKNTYQLKTVKLYSSHQSNTTVQPTRHNILLAIQSHINLLQKGDIFCLFYAGHGSQEVADPYFQSPTGYLSTLVPTDSGIIENGKPIFDILSVEIRQLFSLMYQKTGVEIILVQDSCHSERATRAYGEDMKGNLYQKREILPRQHPNFGQKRSADNYEAFPEAITRNLNQQNTPNSTQKLALSFEKVVPEAPHIHLCACAYNECAYETKETGNPSGIFTTNLSKLLKITAGNISYHELEIRLRMAIEKGFAQTPSLYIKAEDKSTRFRLFLNQNSAKKVHFYNLIPVFDSTNKGYKYKIDVGALQGLPLLKSNERFEVEISNLNDKKGLAYVNYVALAFAELENAPDFVLNSDGSELFYAQISADKFINDKNKLTVGLLPIKENENVAFFLNLLAESMPDGVEIGKDTAEFSLYGDEFLIYLYKNNINEADKKRELLFQFGILANKANESEKYPCRSLNGKVWEIEKGAWAVVSGADLANNFKFIALNPENQEFWTFGLIDYLLPADKTVFLRIKAGQSEAFAKFMDNDLCNFLPIYTHIVENTAADVYVSSQNDSFGLLDAAKSPLTRVSRPADLLAAVEVSSWLKTMAIFKQRLQLNNPHPNRLQSFLGVELLITVQDLANNKTYQIPLQQAHSQYSPLLIQSQTNSKATASVANFAVAVNYKNQVAISQSLQVALLYMSRDYSISPIIEPTTLAANQNIGFSPARSEVFGLDCNPKTQVAYIKVLISWGRFELSEWLQSGLPLADVQKSADNQLRSMRQKGESAADWNAFALKIVFE